VEEFFVLTDLILLLLSLVIILISCDMFTNGIEWLGKKLHLGEGVTGSIFAAVGTCLPETLIPIIAILSSLQPGDTMSHNMDIGIGAIIGAPFMLSTLAFFITGFSVLVFCRKRRIGFKMQVNSKVLGRDIGFFIIMYTMGAITGFITIRTLKYYISALLILCYIFYMIQTFRYDMETDTEPDRLYASVLLKKKPGLPVIIVQVISSLLCMIFGAKIFIGGIEKVSEFLGISALVLSLVITPIATELPEKFNSVIWIWKRKDTLAIGNISGAMVFQSCIPVALGISATHWQLEEKSLVCVLLALLSALTVYIYIKIKKSLSPVPLLAGGLYYAAFILYLFISYM